MSRTITLGSPSGSARSPEIASSRSYSKAKNGFSRIRINCGRNNFGWITSVHGVDKNVRVIAGTVRPAQAASTASFATIIAGRAGTHGPCWPELGCAPAPAYDPAFAAQVQA